jgi:hypothetical protein
MNTVMIKGTIVSEEIKVLNTDKGFPLCRFTLQSGIEKYHCMITGKQAYSFLFEAEKGTTLSFSARVNTRGQLIVLRYFILQKPSYFGKIYNYKGQPLPL